jgi:hypothetical protein
MSHDVFFVDNATESASVLQTRFLQFFAALFQVLRECLKMIEPQELIAEYWYQMLQKEGCRESLFSEALEHQVRPVAPNGKQQLI